MNCPFLLWGYLSLNKQGQLSRIRTSFPWTVLKNAEDFLAVGLFFSISFHLSHQNSPLYITAASLRLAPAHMSHVTGASWVSERHLGILDEQGDMFLSETFSKFSSKELLLGRFLQMKFHPFHLRPSLVLIPEGDNFWPSAAFRSHA